MLIVLFHFAVSNGKTNKNDYTRIRIQKKMKKLF
jgi:hypothetical protein